ncbi:uncharacterized protein LOC110244892 isoform X4 [Exaiptasia diaphana]|uniref:Uncharacterized protein n=1 Tax=Exaiptasia diaphana TaxID=2652724 RepID=A0A913YN31_EXADI|nr:uncharacterized protein LOC110244892 isoform X4 [Exaiptasia diaphana]
MVLSSDTRIDASIIEMQRDMVFIIEMQSQLSKPSTYPVLDCPSLYFISVIMCFAEMFVGCGLAIIDRNQMVCDSPVQQLGRQGYGVVRNMNFPSNQENLPGNQTQLDKSIKRDSDETMLL